MTATVDLGGGHEYAWIRKGRDDDGELTEHGTVIGLTERHPTLHGQCSVMVFWVEHGGVLPTHELVDGGPDSLVDLDNVTVSPDIECELCGTKGEIVRGAWFSQRKPK